MSIPAQQLDPHTRALLGPGNKGRNKRKARALKTTPSAEPIPSDDDYGIIRQKFYRISLPETEEILGVGETAIKEMIEAGLLDPPVPLTAHGRAKGWWGHQLLAFMRARIKAAPKPKSKPPKTKVAPKNKKKKGRGR